MSNLATHTDFSVQLQSASYSNCSTKISKAAINSQPALFILLLIFLVLFLANDTEESSTLQSMCALFVLMVFNTIFLSQGADLVLLHSVLTFYHRDSNISCLPFQNRWTESLKEYLLTSCVCFGPFRCETGSALVKLVYLVLHIPEYKVRLNTLHRFTPQPFHRHPNLKHILSTSESSVPQMGGWTGPRDGLTRACEHRG